MQGLQADLTAIKLENDIPDSQSPSLVLSASFCFDNPRHTALVAWNIQALYILNSTITREKAVSKICGLKTAGAHVV